MIDQILAKYWTPKGTPLWRHHLPSILIAYLLIGCAFSAGLQNEKVILTAVVAVIVCQFSFSYLARKRFGNNAPKHSSYYN